MVVNGIVAAVLTDESISDIKTKSISLARLVCYMIVALALNIIMRYQSFISLFGGIIVGVIFLGFGILTKEGIGYGDGAIFICVGAVLGLYANLSLVMYSLMLAAIVGGIYALVRKKNLKVRIPFIPCVLITYVVMTLVGVIV